MFALNAWRVIRVKFADGLTPGTFASKGTSALTSYVRLSKVSRMKRERVLANKVAKVINGQYIAVGTWLRTKSWDDELAAAMNRVFEEEGVKMRAVVKPDLQGTMAQGYSRTHAMMGTEPPVNPPVWSTEVERFAQQVTRVNDTTRQNIEATIRRGLESGQTIGEIAGQLVDDAAGIAQRRAITIARTEIGRAWANGAIRSMIEGGAVSHVSVIGCQSREEARWGDLSYQPYLYRGESTCNIKDVPIEDALDLEWHPNHTGTVVPSRFRGEEGAASMRVYDVKYNPYHEPGGRPEGGQFTGEASASEIRQALAKNSYVRATAEKQRFAEAQEVTLAKANDFPVTITDGMIEEDP
jgi:hypothetical protein